MEFGPIAAIYWASTASGKSAVCDTIGRVYFNSVNFFAGGGALEVNGLAAAAGLSVAPSSGAVSVNLQWLRAYSGSPAKT